MDIEENEQLLTGLIVMKMIYLDISSLCELLFVLFTTNSTTVQKYLV